MHKPSTFTCVLFTSGGLGYLKRMFLVSAVLNVSRSAYDLLFLAHHPDLVGWLSPPQLFQMLECLSPSPTPGSQCLPYCSPDSPLPQVDESTSRNISPVLLATTTATPRSRWPTEPVRAPWRDISATLHPDSIGWEASGTPQYPLPACDPSPCAFNLTPNFSFLYRHV